MLTRTGRPFRLAAWLALAAMLALALAPSVSRALAASRGEAGFAEVCTSVGIRFVDMTPALGSSPGAQGEAGGSGENGAVATLEHTGPCPLCAVGPIGGVPGEPAAAGHRGDGATLLQLAPPEAPRPVRIALAASPRGPPALRA
jgi:hypothetical protein